MSNTMVSTGERNTRCRAIVSSTTPRLGPRCPPVWETELTRNSRISAASRSSRAGLKPRRSSTDVNRSSSPTRCPPLGPPLGPLIAPFAALIVRPRRWRQRAAGVRVRCGQRTSPTGAGPGRLRPHPQDASRNVWIQPQRRRQQNHARRRGPRLRPAGGRGRRRRRDLVAAVTRVQLGEPVSEAGRHRQQLLGQRRRVVSQPGTCQTGHCDRGGGRCLTSGCPRA